MMLWSQKSKKKKRARRHHHALDMASFKNILIYGLGGGSLLGLLVLGGDFLMKHPPHLFDIREIIVAGSTSHLNEFDILKLSEVKIGDDLLILPLAEVKERMERYLWVKQVHLLKRYPHRL